MSIGGSLSKIKDPLELDDLVKSDLKEMINKQLSKIFRLNKVISDVSNAVKGYDDVDATYYTYTTHVDQMNGKFFKTILEKLKFNDRVYLNVVYGNDCISCRFKVQDVRNRKVYEVVNKGQ